MNVSNKTCSTRNSAVKIILIKKKKMRPEFPLIFNLAISNVPGTNPLFMNWFEIKYKHNSKGETILCTQFLIL